MNQRSFKGPPLGESSRSMSLTSENEVVEVAGKGVFIRRPIPPVSRRAGEKQFG